jgi:hypothetical protein
VSKRDRSQRVLRGLPPMSVTLLLAVLALLLAACAGGASAAKSPTTTPATASGSQTPTAPSQTPVTISTPGAPVGVAGLCALPVSVSAKPSSDIPIYPNAQLHVGSEQNGNGLFGYCSTATVADVANFYAAKIPANGWQNLSDTTIGGTDQLMASKGSATLVVTVLADSQVTGSTDIIIVANASGS